MSSTRAAYAPDGMSDTQSVSGTSLKQLRKTKVALLLVLISRMA